MGDERIGTAGDIETGEVKAYEVDGTAVAVANVDGSLRAFHNECTHKQCALDDGDLGDGGITCACHGSTFDLESGEVRNPPATEPIAVYAVREEDGNIIVTL